MLVAPIAWFIFNDQYALVLLLITIAGITDLLDGLLARAFAWQSRLGSFLDPIADKTLMVVTFVGLAMQGLIPGWLFIAVVVRDMIIISGALAYQKKTHALEMQPTLSGKLNTALQILLVVILLVSQAGYNVPVGLLKVMPYGLLITTIISGFIYVSLWSNKARAYDSN